MHIGSQQKRHLIAILCSLLSIGTGILIVELLSKLLGLGTPLLYEEDHLVGFRPRPNQMISRKQNTMVTINHEGFRVSREQEITDDIPIVFVGDSVTFGGTSIDDRQIFSHILCQQLKLKGCINGAVNGWGTPNMGRLISNLSLYTKRPIKQVILVILPGDDERNLAQLKGSPFWSNYPLLKSGLIELTAFLIKLHLIPALESKDNVNNLSVSSMESRRWASRQQHWDELRIQLDKSSVPIMLAISPPLNWFTEPEAKQREKLFTNLQLDKTQTVPKVEKICNIIDKLPKTSNPGLWFIDNAHLSIDGHKAWARALASCINNV